MSPRGSRRSANVVLTLAKPDIGQVTTPGRRVGPDEERASGGELPATGGVSTLAGAAAFAAGAGLWRLRTRRPDPPP